MVKEAKHLVESLREDAEWARGNEWETPITLGDNLEAAASMIESLTAELETTRHQLEQEYQRRCWEKKARSRINPSEIGRDNGEYEKPVKGESEVKNILGDAEKRSLVKKAMTVSRFKELWPVLRPYSSQQIGVALSRCGVESKKGAKGKRTRELPTPTARKTAYGGEDMSNDEKRREKQREWRRNNPEKVREYRRNYLRKKALAEMLAERGKKQEIKKGEIG